MRPTTTRVQATSSRLTIPSPPGLRVAEFPDGVHEEGERYDRPCDADAEQRPEQRIGQLEIGLAGDEWAEQPDRRHPGHKGSLRPGRWRCPHEETVGTRVLIPGVRTAAVQLRASRVGARTEMYVRRGFEEPPSFGATPG